MILKLIVVGRQKNKREGENTKITIEIWTNAKHGLNFIKDIQFTHKHISQLTQKVILLLQVLYQFLNSIALLHNFTVERY